MQHYTPPNSNSEQQQHSAPPPNGSELDKALSMPLSQVSRSKAPFDWNVTRVGADLDRLIPPTKIIVEGILPAKVGLEAAPGGIGKSTRHLYEAIHIILGKPLYGRRIVNPGPVVYFTKEDEREPDVLSRLQTMVQALGLGRGAKSVIREHLHIVDMVGADERLIKVDNAGNLVPTGLHEKIINSYAGEDIALIEFDPLTYFGPGERFVNDAESALMGIGGGIAKELGCAVRYTHHVSKVVNREEIIDIHAGRGGSALGDNARFVWVYVQNKRLGSERVSQRWLPPKSVLGVEAADLYRLHVPKMSFAPFNPDPIWIERKGFNFIHHAGAPKTAKDILEDTCDKIVAFIERELQMTGAKHSISSVKENYQKIGGVLKKDVEPAIKHMLDSQVGRLRKVSLPKPERHAGKNYYLEVVRPNGSATEEDENA